MAVREEKEREERVEEERPEFDRWLRQVLFSSAMPPSAEIILEDIYANEKGDHVRVYVWKWKYAGQDIYGLDVHVCDNNVLALRALDEEAVERWLKDIKEIVDFVSRYSVQCLHD